MMKTHQRVGKYCAWEPDALVKYHVVYVELSFDITSNHENVLLVPQSWIDSTNQYVLYPPKEYDTYGLPTKQWGEIRFKNRINAKSDWYEYKIADFASDRGPGNYT